jgi:hypothetical protein
MRPIHAIAREIRKEWPDPYFGYKAYMKALESIVDRDSKYLYEDGHNIVIYAVSNMNSFSSRQSPHAARLKAELKERVGMKLTKRDRDLLEAYRTVAHAPPIVSAGARKLHPSIKKITFTPKEADEADKDALANMDLEDAEFALPDVGNH